MGFQLVPTSVTLNGSEWRNSPYFASFLQNSIVLQADYVTVNEDRPIMSQNIVFQSYLAKTDPLCDSWASCSHYLLINPRICYSIHYCYNTTSFSVFSRYGFQLSTVYCHLWFTSTTPQNSSHIQIQELSNQLQRQLKYIDAFQWTQ